MYVIRVELLSSLDKNTSHRTVVVHPQGEMTRACARVYSVRVVERERQNFPGQSFRSSELSDVTIQVFYIRSDAKSFRYFTEHYLPIVLYNFNATVVCGK